MADKPKSGDEDEREALRAAFAGVKPLATPSKKRPAPPPDARAANPRAKPRFARPPAPLLVQRDQDGGVIARQKTTHPSILAALEDPRLEPNAECDLHGMTVSQSDAAVLRFVRNHQGRGDRWVLIIVGKGTHSPGGRSTLRDSVIEALSRGEASRFVLAFRTAPRALGGTGALAVRLVDRIGPDR